MKKPVDKVKVAVIGAVILVVLFMVLYTMSVISKNNRSSATSVSEFEMPAVNEKTKSDLADDYNSRLASANLTREETDTTAVKRNMDFKTYDSDEPAKSSSPNVPVSAKKRPVSRTLKTADLEKNNMPETSSQVEEPESTATASVQEPAPDRGGFGIAEQKIVPQKTKSNTVTATNGGFIPAMLEEDTKIKNQSSVVFYLLQDCKINGVNFKKNSFLYGKSTYNNGVFDIYITNIMNTDGKMFSVNNVLVYDEKYSRGLPSEGNLNEALKESTNQTSNDAANTLATTAGTAVGSSVDLAVNAVDNTVRALSKKKEPSISLIRGYRVFIKE